MPDEEVTTADTPHVVLYRALTLVSVHGQRYGHNQHFHAEPSHVQDLINSGQIEAADPQ